MPKVRHMREHEMMPDGADDDVAVFVRKVTEQRGGDVIGRRFGIGDGGWSDLEHTGHGAQCTAPGA